MQSGRCAFRGCIHPSSGWCARCTLAYCSYHLHVSRQGRACESLCDTCLVQVPVALRARRGDGGHKDRRRKGGVIACLFVGGLCLLVGSLFARGDQMALWCCGFLVELAGFLGLALMLIVWLNPPGPFTLGPGSSRRLGKRAAPQQQAIESEGYDPSGGDVGGRYALDGGLALPPGEEGHEEEEEEDVGGDPEAGGGDGE
jgi:hypothetical protein